MKRRRLILGLGAMAAGGATAVGAGAFTSVEADRDIAVEVADDTDAFLRLAPCDDSPNGDYVDTSDGMLTISLSGDNDNDQPSGSGVNQQALSKFHNVFEIQNQGTQPVYVNFGVDEDSDVPTIPDDADVPDRYDFGSEDPAVVFYEGDSEDVIFPIEEADPEANEAIELDVGESQCFGFNVRAFGFDSGEDIFADTDLTIIADAEADVTPDVADLEATVNCYTTGENTWPTGINFEIKNKGTASTDEGSLGFAVLNSLDEEGDVIKNDNNLDPDESSTRDLTAALPLRGIVFWTQDGVDPEDVPAPQRDDWTADDDKMTGVGVDLSEEDGAGKLGDLEPDRYNSVEDIDDFDDFESEFAGDLDVDEDAFITEIDFSEFDFDSVENWEDGDVGISECD